MKISYVMSRKVLRKNKNHGEHGVTRRKKKKRGEEAVFYPQLLSSSLPNRIFMRLS